MMIKQGEQLLASQLVQALKIDSLSHRTALYRTIGVELAKCGRSQEALEVGNRLTIDELEHLPAAIFAQIEIQGWSAAQQMSTSRNPTKCVLLENTIASAKALPDLTTEYTFNCTEALWQICLALKSSGLLSEAEPLCHNVVEDYLHFSKGFRAFAGTLPAALTGLAEVKQIIQAISLTKKAADLACLDPSATATTYGHIAAAGYSHDHADQGDQAYRLALETSLQLPAHQQTSIYASLAEDLFLCRRFNELDELFQHLTLPWDFASESIASNQAHALALQGRADQARSVLLNLSSPHTYIETLAQIGEALLRAGEPTEGLEFIRLALDQITVLIRSTDSDTATWAKAQLQRLAAAPLVVASMCEPILELCRSAAFSPTQEIRLRSQAALSLWQCEQTEKAAAILKRTMELRAATTEPERRQENLEELFTANCMYARALGAHSKTSEAADIIRETLLLALEKKIPDLSSTLNYL
ncbi:MAG: hypothetical protein GX589_04130, partial [Deltaproteobacteria bacterium]|nr:hypothetical protein [Deltaproteobacteria bacterium]